MEASPKVLAKRLWSIVRIAFFMIRKGISKKKIMVHLHNLMNKRGKISAKVIIGSLMFPHHHTCVIPREYEFSCSNSPANYYPSSFHFTNKGRKTNRQYSSVPTVTEEDEDVNVVSGVQKIMEMLNNEVTAPEASPLVNLPGFGCSPMMNVRQLRITDSPFPLKEVDEDSSRVDKAAEEFIQKFYAQLRLQNNIYGCCNMHLKHGELIDQSMMSEE